MKKSLELIEILKQQHKDLENLLSEVKSILNQPAADYAQVLELLTKLKQALTDHVRIENEEFYPKYGQLLSMLGKKFDNDEKLKIEMNRIVSLVFDFLATYASAASIADNLIEFKKSLASIENILKIRIETEEEGLFDAYVALSS